MKKCLLVCDLEGIYGVKNLQETEKNRECLLSQIQRTTDVIYEKWNTEIIVCLIHNDGMLIQQQDFGESYITFYSGFQKLLKLDEKIDYAFLIGFHSKNNGTGLFPHSFRMEIEKIRTGNQEIGEVYLYTLFLLEKGIQVIFVSGEGDFSDEIISEHIVEHNICDMNDYENKLRLSMCNASSNKITYPMHDLYILLNHSDLYPKLAQKFQIRNGNEIYFKSVNSFFMMLESFAITLNLAWRDIFDKNLEFINYLKHLNLSKKDIEELDNYSNRNPLLFSKEDRDRIIKALRRYYDDEIAFD